MAVEPARHLFTVGDFERMDEVGLFPPDQRLELLGGEIIEMTPIGSPHGGTVNRLTHWFVRGVGDRAIVSVQGPARVSDLTESLPDLMLLAPRDDFYTWGNPRPADVLLLIEVADSTARFDRGVKRPLYAAGGILETWIIDLNAAVIEIATEPSADGYRTVRAVGRGEHAVPSAFPDLALAVDDLFA